jgi:hypothetical protein
MVIRTIFTIFQLNPINIIEVEMICIASFWLGVLTRII